MSLLVLDCGTVNSTIDFVQLPHPGGGQATATFGFIKRDGDPPTILHLCELHRAENEQSSLFVENTVRKDGVVFLCTPCDPNFLLLALLNSAVSAWMPVSQLLASSSSSSDQYKRRLARCQGLNVDLLAQRNQDECVRVDDGKVLLWLCGKVDKLVSELATMQEEQHRTEGGSGSGGAQRAAFVQFSQAIAPPVAAAAAQADTTTTTTTLAPPNKEHVRQAVLMVGDYLGDKWKYALQQHYAVTATTTAASAASSTSWNERNGYGADPASGGGGADSLRFSRTASAPAPAGDSAAAADATLASKKLKQSPPPVLSAAQKRAAKGTPSVASFFAKKS